MKRSKCSEEQILAIAKEGEAGRKVTDVCRANGITRGALSSRRGAPQLQVPPKGTTRHSEGERRHQETA
jgi:Transposase